MFPTFNFILIPKHSNGISTLVLIFLDLTFIIVWHSPLHLPDGLSKCCSSEHCPSLLICCSDYKGVWLVNRGSTATWKCLLTLWDKHTSLVLLLGWEQRNWGGREALYPDFWYYMPKIKTEWLIRYSSSPSWGLHFFTLPIRREWRCCGE